MGLGNRTGSAGRPTSVLIRPARIAAALLLAACGGQSGVTSGSSTTTLDLTPTTVPTGQLAGLSIELILDQAVLAPGGETSASLHVQNDTDAPIEQLGCTLANTRFGVVPADQPDAPLHGRSMTDCSGEPFVMDPGFDETWAGHSFNAVDVDGDGLPPGDYLAVIEADDGNVVVRAALTVA